jgi:hypothetical protein
VWARGTYVSPTPAATSPKMRVSSASYWPTPE